MKELEKFDISLEEFDELTGEHVFSKQYQQQKRTLLKEYRKRQIGAKRATRLKVAAASAVVLVSTPIIATAALNGELFNRLWGEEGKSNIESHDEVVYEPEKDTENPAYVEIEGNEAELAPYYVVTYPEREYVEMDEKKAEELIGKYMEYPGIAKEISDGTTLTIESVVRDKNAAIIYFTLENKNGVRALNYSQLDNEAKGAWFAQDAPYYFIFGQGKGGGHIYVDLYLSTETKLYCYDYMKIKGSLDLDLYENPINEVDGWNLETAEKTTIRVPRPEKVPSMEYVNSAGGILSISPISITIDMSTGLGLNWDASRDSASCYYVAINYKDGTKYTVCERSSTGHESENYIDNASYICGGSESDITFLFNRLVDVNEIESIIVNDTVYIAK